MEKDICLKTESDAISDEDRSDAFDNSIDIKYEPLAIKEEPEIPELEDFSIQINNIAKPEEDFPIKREEIGSPWSPVERKCDICGDCFSNGFDLNAHRYCHTEETFYTCCICNCKTFHLKPDLYRHMLNIHFNITFKFPIIAKRNAPKPGNNSMKTYSYDKRDDGFTSTYKRNRFPRIPIDEKQSHECGVCHTNFKYKSNLTQHERIHTGEKPYEWNVCHKSFYRTTHLTQHERIHTGEKPYECDFCHKSFSIKWKVTTHARIHTGEKPYECAVCHRGFNTKAHLTQHEGIHTGEKPYECNVCHKRFRQKAALTRHKRSRHTDVKP